MYIEYIKFYR